MTETTELGRLWWGHDSDDDQQLSMGEAPPPPPEVCQSELCRFINEYTNLIVNYEMVPILYIIYADVQAEWTFHLSLN